MKSNNQKIKYSPEYISYLANGDSAAVFITRDIVKSINTENKWIDVIEPDWEYKILSVKKL